MFVKAFNRGTTNDLYVGAPKIVQLNSQDNWTIQHKLGTYGVEYATDEDSHNPKGLFWRTMSSFGLENPEVQPYFTANNDGALLDIANLLTAKYMAERNNEQSTIDGLEAWGFPCNTMYEWYFWTYPFCIIKNNQHSSAKNKRDAWQKGLNWMLAADETYKTIIGAVDTELLPTCVCTKEDPEGDAFSMNMLHITNEADCIDIPLNSTYDECVWKTILRGVRKESDGVVLRESAQAFPGALGYFRMDKSNHFQMRNDSNTKNALLWIYNSSLSGGGSPALFFQTLPK
jgi:hypothetical protein